MAEPFFQRLTDVFRQGPWATTGVVLCLLWTITATAQSDWRTTLADPRTPIPDRVAAAFEGMEQDSCFDGGPDAAQCPRRRYSLAPAHIDPRMFEREAILIVDVLPPAVEYLRYRHRILGVYEVTSHHTIVEQPVAFDLPEVFGEIITGFASSAPIASEALEALLPELNRRYGDFVPVAAAHGTAVFNLFADLVPSHPLVLLDNNRLTFSQADPELFCSISDHPERTEILRQLAQQFADALRALMVEHRVRYVNASFGFTIETIRGPWDRVCGTPLPSDAVLRSMLDAYRPIFDALFNTPGVLAAHAALASPNDLDAPFDQPGAEFPNRLRVGSLGTPDVDIPALGASMANPGWDPVPKDPGDADIWINAGCSAFGECRESRPLTLSIRYGMGRRAFPLPQSSFVTPIALARLADLRNRPDFRRRTFDDELIDDLFVELLTACAGADPCRHFDPLLHGQAERFRNDHEPERRFAGLWYDPLRSGHGLEIQRFGPAYAGLFYSFTESGEAEWLWMEPERYGSTLYGTFLRFVNRGTADLPDAASEPVGHFTLSFEPNSLTAGCPDAPEPRAAFVWSIAGASGVWCLQPLLVQSSRPSPNANGLWWNGPEDSGWGFGTYANQVTEFRVIYYYDPAGSPVWAFGQDVPGHGQVELFHPAGFCRTCTRVPLTLESTGIFSGPVRAPSMDPSGEVSIDLGHWLRTGIRPLRFSD